MTTEEDRQHLERLNMYLDADTRENPSRESSLQSLLDKAQASGPAPLLDLIAELLTGDQVGRVDIQLVVKILKNLQQTLTDADTQAFLEAVQPLLLLTKENVAAKEMIHSLAKSSSLDSILDVIAAQVNDDAETVRDVAAITFGVVASALGVDEVILVLGGFLLSRVSTRAHCTVLRMVEQVALATGCAIRPHITILVGLIEAVPTSPEAKVPMLVALGALAEAAKPSGLQAFERWCSNLQQLKRMAYVNNEQRRFFLQLHCSILTLVPLGTKRSYLYAIVRNFSAALASTNDSAVVGIGLKGLKRAFPLLKVVLQTDPLGHEWLDGHIPIIVCKMWGWKGVIARQHYELLVDATVAMGDLVSMAFIYKSFEMYLPKISRECEIMIHEVIHKIVRSSWRSRDDAEFRDLLDDIDCLFTTHINSE